jgi:hypothetical protein
MAPSHQITITRQPDRQIVRVDGQELVVDVDGGPVPNWEPLIKRLKEIRQEIWNEKSGRGLTGTAAMIWIEPDDEATYEVFGSVMLCGELAGFIFNPSVRGDGRLALDLDASRKPPLVAMSGKEGPGDAIYMDHYQESQVVALRIALLHVEPYEQHRGEVAIRLNNSEVADMADLTRRLTAAVEGERSAGHDPAKVQVLISPDMGVQDRHVRGVNKAAIDAGIKWITFTIPK